MSNLNHIAIIPDGNRRWGKINKISNDYSLYEIGANNFHDTINYLFEHNVKHVTFWLSSLSNLKNRPIPLIKATNRLYYKKFKELLNDSSLMENRIKINVIGSWNSTLENKTIKLIEKLIYKTRDNDKAILTLLIAYDGKTERGEAIKSLLNSVNTNNYLEESAENLEELMRMNSWTGSLPNVDLLIRTGSWEDPHNSADFLSLLTGESQFIFPESYWPEYSTIELKKSLENFFERERRKGK